MVVIQCAVTDGMPLTLQPPTVHERPNHQSCMWPGTSTRIRLVVGGISRVWENTQPPPNCSNQCFRTVLQPLRLDFLPVNSSLSTILPQGCDDYLFALVSDLSPSLAFYVLFTRKGSVHHSPSDSRLNLGGSLEVLIPCRLCCSTLFSKHIWHFMGFVPFACPVYKVELFSLSWQSYYATRDGFPMLRGFSWVNLWLL
jgi:hypothetical protein